MAPQLPPVSVRVLGYSFIIEYTDESRIIDLEF